MAFYAHTGNDREGRSDWQGLKAHLEATAAGAAIFAAPFGGERAAFLAGLLHDLGKYTEDFRRRLEGAGIRVDHSTAGAALVREMATGADAYVAQLIAYCIAGHHAGLPDGSGNPSSLKDRIKAFDRSRLDETWRQEIAPDFSGLVPPFPPPLTFFQFAFFGRMLFSCLVDADYKDTEAHYAAIDGVEVDRQWPELQAVLADLQARLAKKLVAFETGGKVNRLRGEILTHVRAQATQSPGLFTLTVPTGGGKTLASLAFALDHAALHGHRRVIYAIPFTSIIDQTASIFRDVLGDENILEHHSSFDDASFDPDRPPEGRDKLRRAMEDWAAPVVVTTNVQFFESLFAARGSRARKLHNIAGSIVILDEAQTLPRHLLAPAARALDELARNYGCTIVLCTATQPALGAENFAKDHPVGLPLEGRELAPDPERLARELRRATIEIVGEMDDDALVEELRATPQGLVIVNSRKHALDLYRKAGDAGLEGLIHLTTRQCAADRRAILADVRERLKQQRPCRLIATSLIEAGVDVDFPRVWRAEAGLDQIMQSAGRCNREGGRPVEESVVTAFKAPDHPPPPEVRKLADDLARVARTHPDLSAPDAMDAFFREVYWRMDAELDRENIIALFRIDAAGMELGYRTAAEKFRMIESAMEPVIIPLGSAQATLGGLRSGNRSPGALARELQNFIVQVPPKDRAKLIANGRVSFERADIYGEQFAVLNDMSLYEEGVGLLWEVAGQLNVHGLIL